MIKNLVLTLFCMFFVSTSYAQITLTQAQLDSLPASARLAVEASAKQAEIETHVKTVSKYVGIGKEVGEAVNGALTAVEEHAISIADSKLGHTAIFLVCWNFLYKDLLGLVVGLILLTIFVCWLCYSLHFMKTNKNFQDWHNNSQCAYVALCAVGWAVLFIASMCSIFG